ncbi:MAG: dihydropteroate synthase [Actinomycetota bacterium]|nr:dihydropteroate synthase [Actinomycetota bacterium]
MLPDALDMVGSTLGAVRPKVMGVLNVTPDSFSDGGQFFDEGAAIRRGMAMIAEGADVVDVGGESSRPGAVAVDETEECRRVVPVVRALAPHCRVSVDTVKERVAVEAVEAGATLLNDVSASLWKVAASTGAGWVAMHSRGTPGTMQQLAEYGDVVAEVVQFLREATTSALDAGVGEVWVDPGIGFAKTAGHNLELLARLGELREIGLPILVGTSRKTFLGRVTAKDGVVPAPSDRLAPSLATAVVAMHSGASMVRVHDVAPTVAAVCLLAGPPPPASYQAVGTGPSEHRRG